ncbi:MAG: LysR family transcriptional regulator [Sporomusaceae bacterium]|nr:LysR family transcriptional regulator [Sporomusaceae bacterium]
MDRRQIAYVLKVAEAKSFSQAAKQLYISQPSLSQYIINIEKQLGASLFDRGTTPLTLTLAGEKYVATASKILALEAELDQEIADIAQLKKGRLTIGSSPFRSTHFLPQILPRFKAKFPGVEIVLAEGMTAELEMLALNGQTDFSIGLLPVDENLFHYEPIFTEEIVAAIPASHPLSQEYGKCKSKKVRPQISLTALKDQPFIMVKSGQRLHQRILDLCAAVGFKPRITLESQSMESTEALVAAGLGVTLLPDTLIGRHQLLEPPCYFSLGDPAPTRTAVILYRKGRYLSRAAREFIDLTKELYK